MAFCYTETGSRWGKIVYLRFGLNCPFGWAINAYSFVLLMYRIIHECHIVCIFLIRNFFSSYIPISRINSDFYRERLTFRHTCCNFGFARVLLSFFLNSERQTTNRESEYLPAGSLCTCGGKAQKALAG